MGDLPKWLEDMVVAPPEHEKSKGTMHIKNGALYLLGDDGALAPLDENVELTAVTLEGEMQLMAAAKATSQPDAVVAGSGNVRRGSGLLALNGPMAGEVLAVDMINRVRVLVPRPLTLTSYVQNPDPLAMLDELRADEVTYDVVKIAWHLPSACVGICRYPWYPDQVPPCRGESQVLVLEGTDRSGEMERDGALERVEAFIRLVGRLTAGRWR